MKAGAFTQLSREFFSPVSRPGIGVPQIRGSHRVGILSVVNLNPWEHYVSLRRLFIRR